MPKTMALVPLEEFSLETANGGTVYGAPVAEDLREFPELRGRIKGIATEANAKYNCVEYFFLLEDGGEHAVESLLLLALRHCADEAEVYYVGAATDGRLSVSALYTKSPAGSPVTGDRHTLGKFGKKFGVDLVPGNIVVVWGYYGWK